MQFLLTSSTSSSNTLTRRNRFLQHIESLSLSTSPKDIATITISEEDSIIYLIISLTPTITTISSFPLLYSKTPISLIDLQLIDDDAAACGFNATSSACTSSPVQTTQYFLSLNSLSSILRASDGQKGSIISFSKQSFEIFSAGSRHTLPFTDSYPSPSAPAEPSINRPEITIEVDVAQLRSIQLRLTSLPSDSKSKLVISVDGPDTFSFMLSGWMENNLEIQWILSNSSIEFLTSTTTTATNNKFTLNSSSFIKVLNSLIAGSLESSSNDPSAAESVILALIPGELVVLTTKSNAAAADERITLFYIPLISD